ncbi:E3 ubiquitin-protein ligase MARCH5 [Astathelohania contejeani]|uniref:E3 ubiquitin-protein ligase MARCH5 n=1 Tax=Astathelohania contejeani TaxID=164912 RepID=A0ABQ7HZR8_9MICR|nr:E3 ubiquitin-protein ligase MARCH5 [Thelohania contejeani]
MERICWICLQEENPNSKKRWIRPCKCKGSTKWSHKSCFLKYIRSSNSGSMECVCCKYKYKIVWKKHPFMIYYELVDKIYCGIVNVFSTFLIALGIFLVFSLYSLSVVYCFIGKFPEITYTWTCFLNYLLLFLGVPVFIISIYARDISTQFQVFPFFYLMFCSESLIIPLLPFLFALYRRVYAKYIEGRLLNLRQEEGSNREGIMFSRHGVVEIKIISYLLIPYIGAIVGWVLLRWINIRYKAIYGLIICTIVKDISKIIYHITIEANTKKIVILDYKEE